MLARSAASLARTATSSSGASIAPRAAILSSVRTYATAPDSKPPVALYGVDGTYASSLYIASAKTSTLDTVDKSLKSLKSVLDKDKKLSDVLASPSLTTSDKTAVIAELTKAAGSGASSDKNFKNLLEVLAENNRLSLIDGIAEKFSILMGAHRGEVEATITSAQALDNRTISRLESAIGKSKYIQQGQKLKVVNKVNPDVLGGLIVEVGDRTIDLSVSSKISKLNKLLTDSL